MVKYQNYLHYKLPITMIPSEFGRLIEQFNNKYIVQLNTTNVAVIKEVNGENFVRFFRRGELMFEFKDTKISENTFTRTIFDQKYTFTNNKLISTEILILSLDSSISIFNSEEFSTINNLITPKNNSKLEKIIKFLGNTNIYKKAELFILFKLSIISINLILNSTTILYLFTI